METPTADQATNLNIKTVNVDSSNFEPSSSNLKCQIAKEPFHITECQFRKRTHQKQCMGHNRKSCKSISSNIMEEKNHLYL